MRTTSSWSKQRSHLRSVVVYQLIVVTCQAVVTHLCLSIRPFIHYMVCTCSLMLLHLLIYTPTSPFHRYNLRFFFTSYTSTQLINNFKSYKTMLFVLHSKSLSLEHSVIFHFFQCFLIIKIFKNQYTVYKHNFITFIVLVFHVRYSMVSYFGKNFPSPEAQDGKGLALH